MGELGLMGMMPKKWGDLVSIPLRMFSNESTAVELATSTIMSVNNSWYAKYFRLEIMSKKINSLNHL